MSSLEVLIKKGDSLKFHFYKRSSDIFELYWKPKKARK